MNNIDHKDGILDDLNPPVRRWALFFAGAMIGGVLYSYNIISTFNKTASASGPVDCLQAQEENNPGNPDVAAFFINGEITFCKETPSAAVRMDQG